MWFHVVEFGSESFLEVAAESLFVIYILIHSSWTQCLCPIKVSMGWWSSTLLKPLRYICHVREGNTVACLVWTSMQSLIVSKKKMVIQQFCFASKCCILLANFHNISNSFSVKTQSASLYFCLCVPEKAFIIEMCMFWCLCVYACLGSRYPPQAKSSYLALCSHWSFISSKCLHFWVLKVLITSQACTVHNRSSIWKQWALSARFITVLLFFLIFLIFFITVVLKRPVIKLNGSPNAIVCLC